MTLPTQKSVRKYERKTVSFDKPIFPNYVFLQIDPRNAKRVYQSDYVANLLEVIDQQTFAQQLDDILLALREEYEVMLAPQVVPGRVVRIVSGPLRGMQGIVEQRSGKVLVLLRLDFIRQSAAVRVEASDVELAE